MAYFCTPLSLSIQKLIGFSTEREIEREKIFSQLKMGRYHNTTTTSTTRKPRTKYGSLNTSCACYVTRISFVRIGWLVGLMSDVLLEMRRNQNMYRLSHYYTGIHIRRVCFVELTPIHIPITFVFRRSLYASFSTALIQSIVFSFVCIFYFCSVCVYIECLNVTNLYQVGSHQSIVSRVFDAHWI